MFFSEYIFCLFYLHILNITILGTNLLLFNLYILNIIALETMCQEINYNEKLLKQLLWISDLLDLGLQIGNELKNTGKQEEISIFLRKEDWSI